MPVRIATACVLFLLSGIAEAAERPVVVELFTSEGCSSCPPADALLTDLARTRPDVLPLAFHVTYWNRLGWRDPFSSEAATQRQARYGAKFGDGSYTPEMVVDGSRGVVGSDRARAEAAIAASMHDGAAAVPIAIDRRGDRLSITLGSGHGTGRIVLVGFDHEHRTAVGRGENGGRTLTETNIVRSIRTVGTWAGPPVTLDAGYPDGEDVAVLMEAPDGTILGAARL